jgi:hypothetical protein
MTLDEEISSVSVPNTNNNDVDFTPKMEINLSSASESVQQTQLEELKKLIQGLFYFCPKISICKTFVIFTLDDESLDDFASCFDDVLLLAFIKGKKFNVIKAHETVKNLFEILVFF